MELVQQSPARGMKRVCVGCAARFFDLGRSPIHCPKCGDVFVPPEPAPPRAPRFARKPFPGRAAYEAENRSHEEKEEETETEKADEGSEEETVSEDVDGE